MILLFGRGNMAPFSGCTARRFITTPNFDANRLTGLHSTLSSILCLSSHTNSGSSSCLMTGVRREVRFHIWHLFLFGLLCNAFPKGAILPFQGGKSLFADNANHLTVKKRRKYEEVGITQARLFGDTDTSRLVPSQSLFEHRLAKSPVEYSSTPPYLRAKNTKKKFLFGREPLLDIDRHELMVYEEVMRAPPFKRKAIVLIGHTGAARRHLVTRLLETFPERYGYPIPRTSRRPRANEIDGREYYFCSREEMASDITAGYYAEFGEYAGNLYGTMMDSIRFIVVSGKTCLLDCSPQCLKLLRSKEFLPLVVFVTAPNLTSGNSNGCTPCARTNVAKDKRKMSPDDQRDRESSRLLRTYEPFLDVILDSDDKETAFIQLIDAIRMTEVDDQWIPVNWVY